MTMAMNYRTALTTIDPWKSRPEARGGGSRESRSRERFLAAIDSELRSAVSVVLDRPSHGGLGLRLWLRALMTKDMDVPEALPASLIQVYLDDPEAVPLHECEDCGLAVPVRPCREDGYEWDAEQAYFDQCPCCGGRTGLYVFRSRPAGGGVPH
jgi:hypothetical protein